MIKIIPLLLFHSLVEHFLSENVLLCGVKLCWVFDIISLLFHVIVRSVIIILIFMLFLQVLDIRDDCFSFIFVSFHFRNFRVHIVTPRNCAVCFVIDEKACSLCSLIMCSPYHMPSHTRMTPIAMVWCYIIIFFRLWHRCWDGSASRQEERILWWSCWSETSPGW